MSIKKLLAGVAISGLVAGAAYADEPAPTAGDPQEAIVNQLGVENYAVVDQAFSVRGEALINQTGDANEAIIFQADDGETPYENSANTATINQIGDRALAVIAQGEIETGTGGYGNEAEITQYGNADDTPGANPSDSPATFPIPVDGRLYTNAAGIGQLGDGNRASIKQGEETREVRGSVAGVLQGGLGNKSLIGQKADGALAANVQFGNNNVSSIDQTDGSGLYNAGGVTPWDPEAIVFQTGEDNVSTVIQYGDIEAGDLSVFVNQYGDESDSSISQTAQGDGFQGDLNAEVAQGSFSTSTIVQTATSDHALGAFAEVEQDNGATSTITQSLNGEGANMAMASVDQDGASTSNIEQTINAEWGSTVDAAVNQSGDMNSSDINQVVSETATAAHHLLAVTNQSGTGNDSDVDQTFNNEASHSFSAFTNQSGDYNASSISQTDAGLADDDSNLTAHVNQAGDYNISDIEQENDGQLATVTQYGDHGHSIVLQLEAGAMNNATVFQGPDAKFTSSIIRQGGMGSPAAMYNYADVEQLGENITSHIEQVGDGNQSIVRQREDARFSNVMIRQRNEGDGEFGNYVYATQNGEHGNLDVHQNGEGNSAYAGQAGSRDLATIDQVGDFNSVSMDQIGSEQTMDVDQDGMYNVAYLNQYGLNVDMTISQEGEGNYADGFQWGESLVATVSQSGTANWVTFDQGGLNNVLDVIQVGSFNGAEISQQGELSAATVNQNGVGNQAIVAQGGGLGNSPVVSLLFGGVS